MIYNIFFIHKQRGLNILQHSFSGSKLDVDLVSGFISALISFINSLQPPTEESHQEKLIRTVDRGDFNILIEPGKAILGILFVNIEKLDVRIKLREIIKEFEEEFNFENWNGTINTLEIEAFKERIFKKFASEIIQISDVPILKPRMMEFLSTHDELDLLGEHNISASLIELLSRIDGSSDVQEISNRLECDIGETVEKIGYLFELGMIAIESPVMDTDIYALTPEAMPIFRLNTYEQEMIENLFGKDGSSILYEIDGSRSVQAIQKKTKIDLEKIREVLQFCSKERLIRRVRVHPFIQPSVEISAFAKDSELSELIDKIARLCDGNHSLQEIAKNLKVPISLVTDFLVTLGDNVEWKKK
ncbi:MAG TPA: hypothetical protein VMV49_00340 [Candidatus Deferrimicrobium sp.]|nr:hypothetical protein [Candidatus Deferrimicrobium sp.]